MNPALRSRVSAAFSGQLIVANRSGDAMTLRASCYWLPIGIGLGLLSFGVGLLARAEGPSTQQVARQVDTLLAKEVFKPDSELAPRVDDATYLRRLWLDIVGDIPTPEHVTAFLLDPAKDKRERVVRELLSNPQFGQNWARYWRDVIMSRRLEDRAALVSNPLTVTLTEKFNENEPWDKIATEFITASGD